MAVASSEKGVTTEKLEEAILRNPNNWAVERDKDGKLTMAYDKDGDRWWFQLGEEWAYVD